MPVNDEVSEQEQPIPEHVPTSEPYTNTGLLLHKIDRTIAILGIISITIVGLMNLEIANAEQIAIAGISGLVGYIGGRSGK